MSSNSELEQAHHGHDTGHGIGHEPAAHAGGEAEHGEGHIHMPSPSIWPIINAFGVTMLGFGFLAGITYGVFGAIIIAYSLWRWAGEMRRDAR